MLDRHAAMLARVRRTIWCLCGAQRTDETLERIEAGRAHPELCGACYGRTAEGMRERALYRARRKAMERARLRRLEERRRESA